MNNKLQLLLDAIPRDDPNYATKLLQIESWYDLYGQNLTCSETEDESSSIIMFLSSSIKERCFWDDDGKFNVRPFVKFLLDNEDRPPFTDLALYEAACLICSEDDIKKIFSRLRTNSLEYFVCERFDVHPYSEKDLVRFWTHYINVIGVRDNNPTILDSFKALLRMYDKNFNVDNTTDIWKCGFECAKQTGCEEGLHFFWNKLESGYQENEKIDKIINIGTHSYLTSHYSSGLKTYYRKNRKTSVLKFCFTYLDSRYYEVFVQKDVKAHGCFNAVQSFIEASLYLHASKLVQAVKPEVISFGEYKTILFLLVDVSKSLRKELLDDYISLFLCLWDSKDFSIHRESFLSHSATFYGTLEKLASRNFLKQPLLTILNYASKDNLNSIIKYGLGGICTTLYMRNERDTLEKYIFSSFTDGNKYLSIVDEIVLSKIKGDVVDLDCKNAFDLFTQGKVDDLKAHIRYMIQAGICQESVLSDLDTEISYTFEDMLLGNFDFSDFDIPNSCMSDIASIPYLSCQGKKK